MTSLYRYYGTYKFDAKTYKYVSNQSPFGHGVGQSDYIKRNYTKSLITILVKNVHS